VSARLIKVEGTGNDFLVGVGGWADRLEQEPGLVRRLCDRHRGIGADGVLGVWATSPDRIRVSHRNADGSTSPFCGNGTRCAALAAVALLGCRADLTVDTGLGPVAAVVRGEEVSLALPGPEGPPQHLVLTIAEETVSGWSLTVGVPHLVVPVDDPEQYDVARKAPALRRHPELGPEGANVNFVAIGSSEPVAVRTWERGVEAETLACGSGMVAAALVIMAERGGRRLRMRPRSGDVLTVEALGSPPVCPVRFTGAARIVAVVEPADEFLEAVSQLSD
jgi:diaminopimelate epimerase